MNAATWAKAIGIVKGLSGSVLPPTPEYVQYCYNALENKFTDNEILQAAVEICSRENLYGQYPGLLLWLKYCPAEIETKLVCGEQKQKWIEALQYCADCDPMLWDYEQRKADVWATGGDRGYKAIKSCGLSIMQIRTRGRDNAIACERMIAELSRAWDDLAPKESLQISFDVAKKILAIDKK